MQKRKLGEFEIVPVGLGCMNLSHAYGPPVPHAQAVAFLRQARELGYDFFDTATIYGAGTNEEVVGDAIAPFRDEIVLASKCGLYPAPSGGREIDGRPARIKKACEDSLKRLKTDVIDLYYLHRPDPEVPIADTAGAFGELIDEGKIRTYGLSEVGVKTLRRAHEERPVTAIQNEYSLWTRNPEIALIEACAELGVSLVAFSPLGRGFLAGRLQAKGLDGLAANDLRRGMPRFLPQNYERNRALLTPLAQIADERDMSMAELALAWVLARADNIVAIPGTRDEDHLAENLKAAALQLPKDVMLRLDEAINQKTVSGARYNAAQQADVETEQFELAAQ